LLASAGISFDVEAVDIDERPLPGEEPSACVLRLARRKAALVAARRPGQAVLAADTVVVVDGLMLGKPVDDHEAAEMLARLAGTLHEVLTGVALHLDSRQQSAVERTVVQFHAMSNEEIAWYVASGEPRDKAGAYAIQGLASRYVARVEGSYSNVVGLPVARVYQLLKDTGVM
jgi:septum formation protein